MCDLKRIQVGDFNIKDAVTLELIEKDSKKYFIKLEKLFENKEIINLNNRKLELFLNGVKLTNDLKDGIYRVYNNNKFVGIGVIEKSLLKRDIIINN